MRAICDSCESAVAVFFCPADEAALCDSCNKKGHQLAALNGCDCQLPTYDKLVCHRTRLPLIDPGNFLRCELCDREPAFFHCEKDAMSLCLHCDLLVHNAPYKKLHARFLILTQQVQLTGTPRLDLLPPQPKMVEADENGGGQNQLPVKLQVEENNKKNLRLPHLPVAKAKRSTRIRGRAKVLSTKLIDLKRKPLQSATSKNKK